MKYRTVKLKAWAVPLKVPRYIVRIDSEHPNGYLRNAGWQVRYRRPFRYFADSGLPPGKRTGRRGSPRESLARATAYLETIYAGEHSKLHRAEFARKKDKLGVPGIRAVIQKKARRNVRHYYLEVVRLPPVLRVPRRFYVGTDNTLTYERYAEIWRKAVAFRRAIEREYRAVMRSR